MRIWIITGQLLLKPFKPYFRRENYPNPYEALKDLTRGNGHINKTVIHKFIEGLKVNAVVKKELEKNYTA